MEEIKIVEAFDGQNVVDAERKAEMQLIVADVIMDFKTQGQISNQALFDRLDKFQPTGDEIEELYKLIEESGVKIINEDERSKEFYDQLLKEVSMDDPVKMYLKDIGKVPLLSPDEETELAKK